MAKGVSQTFRALFDVIPFEIVSDPDEIASGASGIVAGSVPGAEVGDFVLVSVDQDITGLQIEGFVIAPDTVGINIFNGFPIAVNLAAGSVFKGTILSPVSGFTQG